MDNEYIPRQYVPVNLTAQTQQIMDEQLGYLSWENYSDRLLDDLLERIGTLQDELVSLEYVYRYSVVEEQEHPTVPLSDYIIQGGEDNSEYSEI